MKYRALSPKQKEIMSVVMKCNSDGSFLDLDQILDTLAYVTTKASLQFSLRALIGRGLIAKAPREKRRGQQRAVIAPTELAYKRLRPVKIDAAPVVAGA